MQTKASSKTGVSFKVNLFSSLKKSIWTAVFLCGLRHGGKQSHSNSIFAFWCEGWRYKQPSLFCASFLHIKCESAMGCNEIEKKILGLIYLPLCEVSRNEGFLWFVFSCIWTESYPILSIHGRIQIGESPHFGICITHFESKELYKVFDTNSKMVIRINDCWIQF